MPCIPSHRHTLVTLLLPLSVLLSSCTALRYLSYRIAPDYPPERGQQTYDLPGLTHPAEILLDAWGVPHIRAEDEVDLARATGFAHGRARFFQMDMLRRVGQGRLSELVGEQPFRGGTTVEMDRSMRGWGLWAGAKADVAGLDPRTRALLEAYADGVNAALAQWTPIEYRLLGVTPEPWTPVDSFTVGRLTSWTITHNWHQELSRLLLALHVGIDRASLLYPHDPWEGGTTLPADDETHPLPPAVAEALRPLFPERPPRPEAARLAQADLPAYLGPRTGASNAWVVGGASSRSGAPLLANDPHLALLSPAFLVQMHIAAPGLDAIGVTIPGLPYVLAGHNGKVAWGMTAATADVVDLVVEKTDPAHPGQVLGPDGRWHPIETHRETVLVRAGRHLEARSFELRRTPNGPVVQDLYPGLLPEWAPLIAIRWHVGEVGRALPALREANRAGDLETFFAAIARISSPINVWTAADSNGRIGVQVNGQVPLRPGYRGTFPVPGWLPEFRWQGLASADAMPRGSGGPRDLFAHANNLLRPPGASRLLLHVDSSSSYRYDRIRAVLEASAPHDVERFRRLQTDVVSLRARRLLPAVLEDLTGTQLPSEAQRQAVKLLEGWDGVARADSAAAAIFFVLYREAAFLALRDEVDDRALAFLLAQRYVTNPIDLWFLDPAHPAWDDRRTPKVERRAEILREALARAVAWLEARQGDDPAKWAWGRAHENHIRHLFGTQPALASFFNLPPRPAPGGFDTVWKSMYDLSHPEHPYWPTAGPSSRHIVDLADPSHAWWISQSGASGWPGSPHYADQYERWQAGTLVPMVSSWPELERSAVGRIRLE